MFVYILHCKKCCHEMFVIAVLSLELVEVDLVTKL